MVKAHWSVIGAAVKGLFREGEGVSKCADGEEVGAHLYPNLSTAIRHHKMTEGFSDINELGILQKSSNLKNCQDIHDPYYENGSGTLS